MSEKKLLFITTGGTIACSRTENGLSPQKNGETLIGGAKLSVSADILDLYSIDSTDVTPAHFRLLHDAVEENLPHYDGIVILHGTDTMAYTGAILKFTVDTNKPVILTGSMLPPDEENSDAAENIVFAAKTASCGKYGGVYLAFCGRIIGGADIVKVSAHEKDAFRPYSGYSPEEIFAFPNDLSPENFPTVIKLSPFTRAVETALIRSVKGAVIETYGAGGLPYGEVLEAIKALAEKIPVIITTPCGGGTSLSRYEVGRRALKARALDSGGMSTECAAVWLWLKITE